MGVNVQDSPTQTTHVDDISQIKALSADLKALVSEKQHATDLAAQLSEYDYQILLTTLELLELLNAEQDVIVAAILYACPQRYAQVEPQIKRDHPRMFGLVEGQLAAHQVWDLHAESTSSTSIEGLRRLLLAIVHDLRVVPILLARQVATLRHATRLPEREREALAILTRDIHAPLANRLGIWQLKWELEDLSFRYLEPDTYKHIARMLDDTRTGREGYIAQVLDELRAALEQHAIKADVAGRPKHIYSIWRKMQKKHLPIEELYDLRAVRVMVDDVATCYSVLGVVHALWVPIPSEFDDYIARPKNNDYRSLHTAVVGPEGKTVEVQIRTFDMHAQAELGVAAHWRYKESGGSQRSSSANAAVEKKIEWMRRLLEANAESGDDNQALANSFSSELVEDRIYVLTPKGEVIDLPIGATVLDFAYRVHTEVGHRCRGAKVDGRIVQLNHALRTGDRVEIMTGKESAPKRDWLVVANGFLVSSRSREKVRAWFHRLDRERNVQDGRELLEKELKRLGLMQADLSPAIAKFSVATLDDLYVLIALGDVGPHQVTRYMLELEREPEKKSDDDVRIQISRPSKRIGKTTSEFTVDGVSNLLFQVAKCCQPLPGEEIVGYLTLSKGVSVHRQDCAELAYLAIEHAERILPVEWGASAGGSHYANILIDANDRKHLLRDITNLIAQENVNVHAITSERTKSGQLKLRLRLRLEDYEQLSRLLAKLEGLAGVSQAHRT